MEGIRVAAMGDQPPTYDEIVNQPFQGARGGELTFVDFLPRCLDPGGFLSKPSYESFRSVIDRANEWLRSNPASEVKTCESVEFKAHHTDVDAEKMTYLEYGESYMQYIRGLRLWVVSRTRRVGSPQQIGYTNLIPQQIGPRPLFGTPTFETVTQLFQRFNVLSRTKPLPGRVITIETQEMKLKYSSDVDPDRSYWTEDGSVRRQFLFVIRIFYDSTEVAMEELGVKDFCPDQIAEGGCFSYPKLQPFSTIVSEASRWCRSQHQSVRICNVQSIEVKCKGSLDSEKTSYTEHGERTTYYIRIVRVAYAIYSSLPTTPAIREITCRTFIPVMIKSGLISSEFETLSQTKSRIEAWVRATGCTVISVETSAMRISTGGERKYGSEATFTYNASKISERWIFVIRIYLDGQYREPPTSALPSVPELQEPNCCVIL